MKLLNVDYSMALSFSESVTDHSFLLRCVPVSRGCQTVTSCVLEVNPAVPLVTYRDVFGNTVYRGQCYAPHSEFSFHVNAMVQVHGKEGTREPCPPFYKYSTPLTACTDEMRQFLLELFESSPLASYVAQKKVDCSHAHDAAKILCAGVHGRIAYTSGATTVRTSAAEAFTLQKGVCQDYAHLFVSLCRAMGIPARYVCGMSKGEGATHAWVEFFVPDDAYGTENGSAVWGRWFGVDPTRNKCVDDDYVILAVGRDFTDCQVDRGVFCGAVQQNQTVFVKTMEFPLADTTGEFSGHSVGGGIDLAGQQ